MRRNGNHGNAAREHFAFGENWRQFLRVLDEQRIVIAERALREMLKVDTLQGMRFLDVGSGSGLSSLAARRLGAQVFSFDSDPQSVACTQELRARYFPGDRAWTIEHGSVLDSEYLAQLGVFDVVYSWGVLHHTGAMWHALANVEQLVGPAGRLFIAIYNDQGPKSLRWKTMKRAYNRYPSMRPAILAAGLIALWGPRCILDLCAGRPFYTWRNYDRNRGMHPWRDLVDWIGGYPFEIAKPEELFEFYRARGFELLALRTMAGGIGCNELVLRRKSIVSAQLLA